MRLLIIGGNSLIGGKLAEVAAAAGLHVTVTNRQNSAESKIDLADDPACWRVPDGITHAVLCAGMTGIRQCADDSALAWRVNVDGSLLLAEKLRTRGVRVVFLSSTRVLGADQLRAGEEATRSPACEYGRQKAAAEKGLLERVPDSVIIRLTKVLSGRSGILRHWAHHLDAGRPIEAFADLFLCPLAPRQAAEAILRITESSEKGVFHLGGREPISYAQLARSWALSLGHSTDLVISVRAPSPNLPEESLLASTRAEVLLGFPPPGLDEVMKELLAEREHQLDTSPSLI